MSKVKLTCENCGKDVYKMPSEVRSKNVFCDRKCWSEYQAQFRRTEKCDYCGKEFAKRQSNFNGKHKFCCRKCKDEWQREGLKGKGNPFFNKEHSNTSIAKMKVTLKNVRLSGKDNPRYCRVPVKCEECGKTTLKIPYLINRNEHQYCSDKCKYAGQARITCGENNPNYNRNLTSEDRKRRMKVLGYVHFKNTVLKRDGYKCVICNSEDSVVVHHLNSYHWDKENRLNPDNAVVLCQKCHLTFHKKYGQKYNTKKQFKEFRKAPTM
ncbi:NUMOD3 domain-containing DNA-binding protein [Enterococcus raffinosus]|uniref:NUMOD3 domain-containing DNA-binding protein n=1 Tax=Enterococcus raffinosus TaxID=71452 RepID=UPI00288F1E48|nr:NUMOD3 domain-containing DNA-binding protein [Enterococcus raffinosus]MDT2570254.1 NUMOD3 domain-containing DNA-binding protein [Enterococcus raffinosus]